MVNNLIISNRSLDALDVNGYYVKLQPAVLEVGDMIDYTGSWLCEHDNLAIPKFKWLCGFYKVYDDCFMTNRPFGHPNSEYPGKIYSVFYAGTYSELITYGAYIETFLRGVRMVIYRHDHQEQLELLYTKYNYDHKKKRDVSQTVTHDDKRVKHLSVTSLIHGGTIDKEILKSSKDEQGKNTKVDSRGVRFPVLDDNTGVNNIERTTSIESTPTAHKHLAHKIHRSDLYVTHVDTGIGPDADIREKKEVVSEREPTFNQDSISPPKHTTKKLRFPANSRYLSGVMTEYLESLGDSDKKELVETLKTDATRRLRVGASGVSNDSKLPTSENSNTNVRSKQTNVHNTVKTFNNIYEIPTGSFGIANNMDNNDRLSFLLNRESIDETSKVLNFIFRIGTLSEPRIVIPVTSGMRFIEIIMNRTPISDSVVAPIVSPSLPSSNHTNIFGKLSELLGLSSHKETEPVTKPDQHVHDTKDVNDTKHVHDTKDVYGVIRIHTSDTTEHNNQYDNVQPEDISSTSSRFSRNHRLSPPSRGIGSVTLSQDESHLYQSLSEVGKRKRSLPTKTTSNKPMEYKSLLSMLGQTSNYGQPIQITHDQEATQLPDITMKVSIEDGDTKDDILASYRQVLFMIPTDIPIIEMAYKNNLTCKQLSDMQYRTISSYISASIQLVQKKHTSLSHRRHICKPGYLKSTTDPLDIIADHVYTLTRPSLYTFLKESDVIDPLIAQSINIQEMIRRIT